MPDELFADRLWYGTGIGPALGRGALAPLSWTFGAVVRARNALYDANVLRSEHPQIPTVSVGNLSVGGTGKTPFAAYIATTLRSAGASPALVMRGVGDDETRAYAILAPNVPVLVDADRARGVRAAASRGADIAVLDDAFQHRRVQRDVDIVLLSADRSAARLLPAGPFREPLTSLSRASCVVVMRKAVANAVADRLGDSVRREFPQLPLLQAALVPAGLVRWHNAEGRLIDSLRGLRVLAVAGIADPRAFFKQLALVAGSVHAQVYGDHHAYTGAEVERLAASGAGFDAVVCTLKDAVKLGPQWPREGPELWYVSQRLEVEKGDSELERILARLLDLRHSYRQ